MPGLAHGLQCNQVMNITTDRRMRRLARLYAARARRDRNQGYRSCDGLTDAICRTKLPYGHAHGMFAMSLLKAHELEDCAK